MFIFNLEHLFYQSDHQKHYNISPYVSKLTIFGGNAVLNYIQQDLNQWE